MRLPLIRFRGGVVAVLPGVSLQKPEIASALKKRSLQLVLVSAAAEDEAGAARVRRSASARAVELGAAVVIASPAGGSSGLHLPAQNGFDLKPQESAPRAGFSREDYRIPWKKLLDLRAPQQGRPEVRPFLDPTPYYQVEI